MQTWCDQVFSLLLPADKISSGIIHQLGIFRSLTREEVFPTKSAINERALKKTDSDSNLEAELAVALSQHPSSSVRSSISALWRLVKNLIANESICVPEQTVQVKVYIQPPTPQ